LSMMPLYCSQGHENDPSNRFCKNCGQQLPLAVGKILEKRYRIVSHLGQGGFGRTYLAEALHRFNERCVLKEFAPQVQSLPELQKAKELFEREAGALHQLRHPQLPGFWELFQADMGGGTGCLFLVQDYVEGQTYFDLFKSGKRLSEAEVIQLLYQILPVLSYIHSKGVIHRDISPDNIILRKSDDLPVLLDFGSVKEIAVTAVSNFTRIGVVETRIGKQGYAPEEQLRHGKVFVNSDLYSLAVTALVLLTGKEPQKLYDNYKAAWRWGQEISASSQLEAVLKKMLAHKPGDRFASADEVLKALPSQRSLPCAPPTISNNSQMQTKAVSPNLNPTPKPTPRPMPVGMLHTPNPNASQVHTLVVAPKALPQPNPTPPNANNPVIHKPPQPPEFLTKFGLWTLKLAVGTGLILGIGFAGWSVMKSVIDSIRLPSLVQRSLTNAPHTAPSSAEQNRVDKILSRRQALGINEASFNAQVNQRFYAKHPELNGRQLSSGPEDAALRDEWYKIAEDVLAN
jgi:serine/threonine-protein kinase